MRYHLITYGCQMNRSDSERIAAVLENAGYKKAPDIRWADLIVVNACSVRQSAIDRVFGLAPKLAKLKVASRGRKLKTVLTGCLLSQDRKILKQRFDLIFDIKNLSNLPKIINQQTGQKNNWRLAQKSYLKISPKYQSPFSAFVPIITGCNNFCSYCVVPFTRGREISRPGEEILKEIKWLVKNEYKEIWLLGQNVNRYRSKLKVKSQKSKILNFAKLLTMINNIPGNFWLRFTSPNPKDFSDELIEVMARGEKITPYLNLPVQSGDDEILKLMNRPYTAGHYQCLVKKIRKKIPGITLSTDAIVGFPAESKNQFKNTVKLFKKIGFDMAYVARYCKRPNTAAAELKDTVSQGEKETRRQVLTEILRQTALEKNKKYVGRTVTVLPEGWKDNFLVGKSREYKTVKFRGPKALIGQFTQVKIINALPWGLEGSLYSKTLLKSRQTLLPFLCGRIKS